MVRPRITYGRILLGAVAVIVLYGAAQFFTLVTEAQHNRRVLWHRSERRELAYHREEYPPAYYERRMRELDAEAVKLGIAK